MKITIGRLIKVIGAVAIFSIAAGCTNGDAQGTYDEANDAFGPEHLVRLSISPVISAPWNEGR